MKPQSIEKVLASKEAEIERLQQVNNRLREAIGALYYVGVWHCDRPVNEAGLWEAVRDAAGFPTGSSPRPIGY